jgi:hypothetical protein
MALFVQSNSWVLYFIIIICLIFIGVGVGTLIKLARSYGKLQQSKDWLTTMGKIISSELDAQMTTDDEGNETTTYLALITFSYKVGETIYESDRINFDYGMRTSNIQKQQSVVKQYPVGREITVYYDPADPQQSVLEKRVDATFTTMLVSAVFIAIGLIVAIATLSVNPPEIIKNLIGR